MQSDDESILTDLEDELEDDEDEVSATQKGRKRSGGAYKLRNALKPPRATTYTAQALYQQIHNGDIELDPEYQRGVVWHKEKQIKLIDSILRNFYIPPIIFAYHCDDDGAETRICIDGKQRLTSIHLFMDGIIPHKDHYTSELLWFKDNGDGKTKKTILPEKYRKIFSNKQIVCVEYLELRDQDERDIFRRVQLGVALTAAEKMNVIATPRTEFIRLLMSRFLTEDTLGNPEIPWSHARGTDFKCLALSVFCISRLGGAAFPGSAQLESWLSETKGDSARFGSKSGRSRAKEADDGDYDEREGIPLAESFKKKVLETFDTLAQLINDKKYNQAFRPCSAAEKISPLEMTGIPILIYSVYVAPPPCSPARGDDRVSLQRLSDLILLMRAYLHKTHKDVRLNSRVGKDMLQFCIDAAKDPNQFFQENSALMGWKGAKGISARASTSSAATTSTSAAAKRKKGATKDEEDEDYKETPKRTRTRVSQTARKSTGGKPSSAKAGAASASTSTGARESPPNPQMLPSPGPGSTPVSQSFPAIAATQPDVKRESVPPNSQQQVYPYPHAQWESNMALLSQMPVQMDPSMIAAYMARMGQQQQTQYQFQPPVMSQSPGSGGGGSGGGGGGGGGQGTG
ncbi:hypothetical protein V5O48_009417 [Marasmius crinis-equi]|uniref:GmrSD restriction endonucleases N-terminal domain-containing protein n=1 Tax=Marasmius crinis-equi TaxID=585013 RepID=A0ABR3FB92_9AGAR